MSDKLLVDLGSGRQAMEVPHHIHVDILPLPHIEYVWDLNEGLPKESGPGSMPPMIPVFKENTIDEFRAHHVAEHIHPNNFMRLMNEMYDALKPGGVLKIYVPNAECPRAAWGDPTHVRAFSTTTFSYFTKEGLAGHPYTTKAWKILDSYPRVNGTPPDDLWEIECWMTPDK